jgi:hypothetical protein
MTEDTRQPDALDAALDDALGVGTLPGGVPEGLASRIVAATADKLPGRVRGGGVIARIGPGRLGALAAAVLLTVGVALFYTLTTPPPTVTDQAIVIQRELLAVTESQPDETIDREIAWLSASVEDVQFASAWDGTDDAIDADLTEVELLFSANGSGPMF